jgi:hypothetical protein
MHATCPVNLNLVDMIVLIIFCDKENYEDLYYIIFLQPPIILFVFGPNIHLSTLFSDIFNLCSSLNIMYKVFSPVFSHIILT